MAKKSNAIATLSLDLDDLWTYLKIRGDSSWRDYPTFLNLFLPKILDLLDNLKIKITFFIVGQDATFKHNAHLLQEITRRGHDIANHSFHHEPWLHQYAEDLLELEITLAEDAIEAVTSVRPRGFRGPGFSWSPILMKVLSQKGYLYDSTTLPTYLAPLARLYYFKIAGMNDHEKKKRECMFGSLSDGFRSIKPYLWIVGNQQIVELPVTTIPIIKTPFHMSYLMYLSTFSETLMQSYLNSALFFCKTTGTPVNFLLHPTDLLGGDLVPQMHFFPGMNLETAKKTELLTWTLNNISSNFHLTSLLQQTADLQQENCQLPIKKL